MIAGLRHQAIPLQENGGYSLWAGLGSTVSKSNYSMSMKSNTQISGEVINQPIHETMLIKREREREMAVTRI